MITRYVVRMIKGHEEVRVVTGLLARCKSVGDLQYKLYENDENNKESERKNELDSKI